MLVGIKIYIAYVTIPSCGKLCFLYDKLEIKFHGNETCTQNVANIWCVTDHW